jgi:hypothetical protein
VLEHLPDIVFTYLTPTLLFWLSVITSFFYLVRGCFSRFRPHGMPKAMMWIFLARTINWAMFAVAWLVFSNNPILISRALLRVTFAFLVTFEVAYHGAYFFEHIVDRLRKWKLKSFLR